MDLAAQYVPPEHCTQLLDGLLRTLNMETVTVIHEVRRERELRRPSGPLGPTGSGSSNSRGLNPAHT